ncbi:DnaJ domain-containing protein [Thiotrichales bacterium 19S3-7]|nr:DnaJ domain-containing protein [Thiotrichales bacterium 19S3-7]MCF6803006.1 DnaJ domain-containing protein [Thiotrichales bacterium 19S3-11]
MADYYQLLGVSKNANAQEIKKAYRRLAKKYHPDVSTEKDAEDKFKDIQDAYEVLKDDQKRKLYDQYGEQWQQAKETMNRGGTSSAGQGSYQSNTSGEYHGFEGYEDIFADLFGRKGAGGSYKRYHSQGNASFDMPGQDLHTKAEISIEEALAGTERMLHFAYQDIDQNGQLIQKEKKLKVKIPKGIANHQQIRLKGQGSQGHGKGGNGDLFIEVTIQSSEKFKVVGNDIYYHVPIAPWEAALGEEISIDTPHAKVKLKVPAHTQTGKKMRLKAKGLAGGDFYVVLDVILPPAVSDEQKAFYKQMSETMAFDPRSDLIGA